MSNHNIFHGKQKKYLSVSRYVAISSSYVAISSYEFLNFQFSKKKTWHFIRIVSKGRFLMKCLYYHDTNATKVNKYSTIFNMSANKSLKKKGNNKIEV